MANSEQTWQVVLELLNYIFNSIVNTLDKHDNFCVVSFFVKIQVSV